MEINKKRGYKMTINHEIKSIAISSIRPNPYQPRKDFNQRALDELTQSIKTFGVIHPISVRRLTDYSYELIAGERRLRASEQAGISEIPAIIVDYRDSESAMIALVENLEREDLNFLEEAEAFNSLINDHGLTQLELAEKLGKSQSTIANKIRLLKLPSDIKKSLIDGDLTERHGRVLLKLPDEQLRRQVLDKVISKNLNVSKTESLVEDMLDDLRKNEEIDYKQNIKSLINIRIYTNTLKKAFKAIREYGIEAEYKEVEKDDHVLIKIKIPNK